MKTEEYQEVYQKPHIKIIQVEIEGTLAISNLENLEEEEDTDW